MSVFQLDAVCNLAIVLHPQLSFPSILSVESWMPTNSARFGSYFCLVLLSCEVPPRFHKDKGTLYSNSLVPTHAYFAARESSKPVNLTVVCESYDGPCIFRHRRLRV